MKATMLLVHPAPYRYEDTNNDYNLSSLFKSYLSTTYPDRATEFIQAIDQTDQYIADIGENVEFLEHAYNSSQNYVIRVNIDFPAPVPFNDEVHNLFLNWIRDSNIWEIPGDFSISYES